MTSLRIPPGIEPSELQRLLHEVNNELSIAIGELELLAERPDCDPAAHEALKESLQACSRAAERLWAVWRAIDGR